MFLFVFLFIFHNVVKEGKVYNEGMKKECISDNFALNTNRSLDYIETCHKLNCVQSTTDL